jgi:hypothetical protein
MEGIALIGPSTRRLVAAAVGQPDTPTAAELAVRAQRVIDDIDRAVGTRTVCACVVCDAGLPYPAVTCRRCTRADGLEHRSLALDDDIDPRRQLAIEYAPGGRILAVR